MKPKPEGSVTVKNIENSLTGNLKNSKNQRINTTREAHMKKSKKILNKMKGTSQ